MDQVVTHHPLTMQASVQFQATPYVIYHVQKYIGMVFFFS